MSKVETLRKKYNTVSQSTFNKFSQGDTTPTKKYLEFMLRKWTSRRANPYFWSTAELIKHVFMFDELLPYIQEKDIYNKMYDDYAHFYSVIEAAQEEKDIKTFKKEDHVFVLEENDSYILVVPKTHTGSLRYGARTRWCTASRKDPNTFSNYQQIGCLAYLIDKTNTKQDAYKKVAFFMRGHESPLSGVFEIYNANDKSITDKSVINGGWDISDLLRITTIYRNFSSKWAQIRRAKEEITDTIKALTNINFESLKNSMTLVEKVGDYDYISKTQEHINSILEKLNEHATKFTTKD